MTAYKKSPALAGNTGRANRFDILQPERLLIQCLVLQPAIFDDLGERVLAIDFADPGYAGLFSALKSQYTTTGDIDLKSAMKAFRDSAGLNESSRDDGCLSEMIAMVTADDGQLIHWVYYARRITDASCRRRWIAVSEMNAADAADQLLSSDQFIKICESRLKRLRDCRRIGTKRKRRPKKRPRKPASQNWDVLAKEIE